MRPSATRSTTGANWMPRLPLAFGWERHSVPTSTLWGRRKALGSAARLGSGRNPGDGKSTASRQSRERRGNQRVRPSMVVPGDNKPITIGDGRKERSVYITLERQIKPQPECRKRFSELYPREATGSKEEPAGESSGFWCGWPSLVGVEPTLNRVRVGTEAVC